MPPRLPPELVEHILLLACADSPPRERRATRNSFRLVCWDWNDIEDCSNELVVLNADELAGAVGAMRRARAKEEASGAAKPASTKVRSLFVSLSCAGLAEVNLQSTRQRLEDVFALLGEMDGLRKLEIEMGRLVCAGYSGDALGALSGTSLAQLRELTLGGPSAQEEPVWCVDELEKCLSRFPNLTSVTLRHCLVVGTAPKTDCVSVFASLHRLASLSFEGVRTANDGLAHLLAQVPPDLRAFSYNLPSLLHCPSHARLISAFLVEHRATLVSLELLDSAACSQIGTLLAELGQFDGALAQLVNLRALAVGPAVLGPAGGVLTALSRLQELEVVQGATRPLRRMAPDMASEAVKVSSSLWRVTLPREVVKEWSGEEWRQLQQGAEGRGVQLVAT